MVNQIGFILRKTLLLMLAITLTSCGETPQEQTTVGKTLEPTVENNDSAGNTDSENTTPEIVYAIVDILGSGDYTNLDSALAAQEPNIKILNGTYTFSENVVVTTENTHIVGESAENVKLIQTNPDKNLIVINANNVTVEGVTLDTRTNNAQAAFVEEGYDNITLKDSIVRGGDKIFCIFFAGPDVTEGAETIAAYQANNLSDGNKVLNNDISCDFSGDGVSFSLQINGEVSGNTFDKAMLAFYMVKDSLCDNNIFNNALQSGIFISLPVYNSTVTNNTVNNPHFYGITVKPQGEHDFSGQYIHSEQVLISNNTINQPRAHGISIDGNGGVASRGDFKNSTIIGNTVNLVDYAGIYAIRSNNLTLQENIITFTGADRSQRGVDDAPGISDNQSAGIYLEVGVTDTSMIGNTINKSAAANADVDDGESVCQNAIRIQELQPGNSVINNTFNNYGGKWMHSTQYPDINSTTPGIFIQSNNIVTLSGNSNNENL